MSVLIFVLILLSSVMNSFYLLLLEFGNNIGSYVVMVIWSFFLVFELFLKLLLGVVEFFLFCLVIIEFMMGMLILFMFVYNGILFLILFLDLKILFFVILVNILFMEGYFFISVVLIV